MSAVTVSAEGRGSSQRRLVGAARQSARIGEEPWGARVLAGLIIVSALSLTGLVIAWVGISGEVRLPAQARWLGLGIGSVLLGGLGMVGWLVIGSARVGALRLEMLRELTLADVDGDSPSVEAVGSHRLGTVPGMRRYHREDCQLLTAKTSSWATARAHAEAGLLPCGICRPPALGSGA